MVISDFAGLLALIIYAASMTARILSMPDNICIEDIVYIFGRLEGACYTYTSAPSYRDMDDTYARASS